MCGKIVHGTRLLEIVFQEKHINYQQRPAIITKL